MEDYLENYKNAAGFLDYCEKCMGYKQIWACPLYDFIPDEHEKNFKYIYIIGTKLTFDENCNTVGEKLNEYINQVCLEEKYILSKKVHAMEKKYPGSIGLTAGNCNMCSQCTRPSERGCKYSEEIRYFLDSIGADVRRTADDFLGIKLQLMKRKKTEQYTLVHGLLTDSSFVEI